MSIDVAGVRIDGLSARCDALAIDGAAPARTLPFVRATPNAPWRVLRGTIRFHASPRRGAASIDLRLLEQESVPLSTVSEREGWVEVRLALGEAGAVHGWVRASDAPPWTGGEGTYTFHGRSASVPHPGPGPTVDCYVGPARFARGAAIYDAEVEGSSWGRVAAGATLVVRDCRHGARMQLAEALGGTDLGWVDALAVERLGVQDCGDVTLVQDPSTLRVRVGSSARSDLRAGDEVVRAANGAVYGPPFDSTGAGTVTPWRLDLVCDALTRGWVVDRAGERVVIPPTSTPAE